MINDILNDAKERMEKSYANMCHDFATMRVGRANPAILDGITVDYYGVPTPLNQTSNINAPEPRLLTIQPWDRNLLGAIEKAIQKADIGINPSNDGEIIRLAIPALTEERRKELVKTAHKRAEEAKVAIRNIRRDVNDKIKACEKNHEATEDEMKKGLDDAQKCTDDYVKKIDETLSKKEKEIMEV
jgi:ribosome recycling factor